jgi:hypothetical protein
VSRSQLLAEIKQVLSDKTSTTALNDNHAAPMPDPTMIAANPKAFSSVDGADSVEANQANQANQAAAIDQSALLAQLDAIATDQWSSLHHTLETKALEQFIATLQQVVTQYPHSLLVRYVQALTQQYDDFEWDDLPETVKQFTDLIAAIENR